MPLQFRISSALKDIIGRDLITDDYIAVFELVKNSYDAHATKVEILFENIYSENAKIIIKDNGKGMNYDDIKNKWLFVAYSAKKEGTEDLDYRERIYQSRPFAGAKGIGRFSCDRLGKHLKLETTRKNSRTEILYTNWEKFESNIKDEFVDIEVDHSWRKENSYGLKHGTILEITELRNPWDRQKFLKLKDSLAKLINPTKDLKERKFQIFINVDDEKLTDENETDYFNIVNGEIKNFIFETLELKTTQIQSSISSDGKFINTVLQDGGTLIYKLREKNKFNLLKDISVTLFYLNQSAKLTFAKRMGVSTTQYGNIFLYKNGFRVYPYGEPGEDPLRVNARYAQGYNRFLGLRNLIGRIEISEITTELKEKSSREGLIKNSTYDSLEDFFYNKILRRLEKYVVDVQEWGLSIEGNFSQVDKEVFLSAVTDNLVKVTSDDDIIDIEYNDEIKDIIENVQNDSAVAVAKNLMKIAVESDNNKLHAIAKSVESKIQSFTSALKELEIKEEADKLKLRTYSEQLKETSSENLFLKSLKSQDLTEVISLMHHVGIYAGTIENYLTGLYNKITTSQPIEKNEIADVVRVISLELKKIINISTFATKANFKLQTEFLKTNVDSYLKEYINNILPAVVSNKINLFFYDNNPTPFIKEIKPIELNIVIDNLINNAKKADAKNVEIHLGRNKEYKFEISVKDDGKGIENKHINKIFDFGFTTTSGSGIGLYHVQQIIKRLNGEITVTSEKNKGTIFTITLN
ncbi:MAG: ATP-binding protein [Verrucomicrobia bacterium]|nr:ATP-binding protein [Verrucomicrobiota bacterium]